MNLNPDPFQVNPDPDPRFPDQSPRILEKYSRKKNVIFFDQKLQFTYP